MSAGHGFADADGLQAVLDRIGGEAAFTDVSAVVEEGFARTDYEAGYTVEVSGDLTGLGDDELTALLGGFPFGWTPEELAAQGVAAPGAGTLTVSVVVPDGEPDRAELDLTGGAPQRASVGSRSTEVRWAPIVFGAAGLALVLLAAVFGVVALVRTIRR